MNVLEDGLIEPGRPVASKPGKHLTPTPMKERQCSATTSPGSDGGEVGSMTPSK